MKKLCLLAVGVFASAAALGADEPFNGSQPMDCKPLTGHDCLPTEQTCRKLTPEPGKDLTLHVDVNKMTFKTPYRNDAMPIQSFSFNSKSLIMQGTNLEMVWNATIHRTTGRLTMTIADREGAYVVFGQCSLAAKKGP